MRLAPLVVALLFVLLAARAAAETPAPAWSVGDTWEYAGWRFDDDGGVLDVAERLTVVARTRLDPGREEVYRVQRIATVARSNETVELRFANLYYRASDLSLVGEDMEVAGEDYHVEVDVVYAPPARMHAFPLKDGKRWAAGSQASVTTSNASVVVWTDPSPTRFEVSGSADLRIPIVEDGRLSSRTFATTIVVSRLGSMSNRSYYSPEAGQFVRRESFDAEQPVGVLEMTSFTYAAVLPGEFPVGTAVAVGLLIPALVLFAARRKISRRVRRTERES